MPKVHVTFRYGKDRATSFAQAEIDVAERREAAIHAKLKSLHPDPDHKMIEIIRINWLE